MKRKVPFILMLVLTIIVSSSLAYAKPLNFNAHLSQEAPGVVTLAQGQAIFKLSKDGDSVSYRLIVANIDDVTVAHTHIAPPGAKNGPPVVFLYSGGLIDGRFQGTLSQGTFTTANFIGPLAGQPMSALLAAIYEGRAYVNVHTTAYPAGEIRGTLK